jgi:hypothetical protein
MNTDYINLIILLIDFLSLKKHKYIFRFNIYFMKKIECIEFR